MKDVMGIIHQTKKENVLAELTESRSLGAVPFGGRYRLIDFALSNMVNSGILNVAIFPQEQYRSMMDHLGSGKEWDLDRKNDGLFILPPPFSSQEQGKSGDMYSYYQHLDYFERSTQQYVVLASSHIVCNINYKEAVEFHKQQGAEVTFLYQEAREAIDTHTDLIYLELDKEQRVKQFSKKSRMEIGSARFLDMIIIDKILLLDLIKACTFDTEVDLIEDILMNQIEHIKMVGFAYEGYVATMDSICHFFHHNLNLLKPEVYKELFFNTGTIFTKVKDEPPTRYTESADVHNSLVANGCLIEGTVENSVLFRGVKVQPGAVIRNSVIMQKCEIEAGAYLENVILDKEVLITEHKEVLGTPHEPTFIIKRGII